MSRSRPEVMGIGLSAAELALAEPVGPGQAPALRSSPWARTASGSMAQGWCERLQALTATAPGRARVTIACDLVRWWVVDTPRGTAALKELRQVAGLRFEQLFGQAAADWAIVGDWSARGPSVCCAVPAAVGAGLRDVAAVRGWSVIDVAAAAVRLRERCGVASQPRREPWVWASVLLDRATLWWHRQGSTFRVCTLGVDGTNPWGRIAQEIRRVGSLWPDGALPAELHWASATPLAAFAEPGLRAVPRSVAPPWIEWPSTTGAAALAAALGCP